MNWKRSICLLLLLLLPSKSTSNILPKDNLSVFKLINFYKRPGQVLLDSLITKVNASDVETCQFYCVEHHSCLSINVGQVVNQTSLMCELNNSTSIANPVKMRRRKGFMFYGPADPCFSNPCLNGATCTSNIKHGTYICDCGLQVNRLPYLNKNCKIDESLYKAMVSSQAVYKGVFNVRLLHSYDWNYYEGKRVCQMFGASLATIQQLTEAWKVGYDCCSYGWQAEGTILFPIYYTRSISICHGPAPPSLRGSRSYFPNKATHKSSTFCYRETDLCNEIDWFQVDLACYKFFLNVNTTVAEANRTCALEGASLGMLKMKGVIHAVKDLLQQQKSPVEQIMVGLRQDASGGWNWNDGTVVDSSLWSVTQPSGPVGTANLRLISLDNMPDGQLLPFLCQKNLP